MHGLFSVRTVQTALFLPYLTTTVSDFTLACLHVLCSVFGKKILLCVDFEENSKNIIWEKLSVKS